jgi:hypothetical protein
MIFWKLIEESAGLPPEWHGPVRQERQECAQLKPNIAGHLIEVLPLPSIAKKQRL